MRKRNDFFDGKGKRKTLKSGRPTASPLHKMPDGSLMAGKYHPGQGPVGPVGPQTSMSRADKRRNNIAIRQSETGIVKPNETKNAKKISASYRKGEFQDKLDQKFEQPVDKAKRRKKRRDAIAKNRTEMESLSRQGPMFTH